MTASQQILQQTNFTGFDWVIVLAYPLISVGFGLYVRKLVKNMKDFVTAGQGLGVWLGIASMTGTEIGLVTVMYSAQKGFTGGFAAFHIALVAGIVTFVVGATGFIVFRLREMRVLTIPEFYERRFDRKTRVLGGIIMVLGGLLNMGRFSKVSSIFIVGVTGWSAASWALPAVMVFLTVLVLFYTSLGGMISVVINDYLQSVALAFALLLATALAIWKLGWSNLFDTIGQVMGPSGIDPTIAERGFGWEYIVWMGFLGLVSCAVWSTSVARALSMETPASVKRLYMFASLSYLIRFLIPYFWGICAFVFIWTTPSLKELFFPAGYPAPQALPEGIKALDNLYATPVFLGRLLPTGVLGVITAGMVAALMGTQSGYLLCWSSVLTQDVVAPIYKVGDRRLSAEARIAITRLFLVLTSVYVLYWGLIYEGRDDIWDYMAVTGAIYFSGAFAVLLGGLYWRRASSFGAFLALIAGLSAVLGLSPVQDCVGIHVPSARVGLISIGSTILAMVFGSLFLPDRVQDDNRRRGLEVPNAA